MAVVSWAVLDGTFEVVQENARGWAGRLVKEADLQVRLSEAVLRKHVAMPGAAGPKELPLQPF